MGRDLTWGILPKRSELTSEFNKAVVIANLLTARDDNELQAIVSDLDRQGKQLYGEDFSLRFDRSNVSKQVRSRVSISPLG